MTSSEPIAVRSVELGEAKSQPGSDPETELQTVR